MSKNDPGDLRPVLVGKNRHKIYHPNWGQKMIKIDENMMLKFDIKIGSKIIAKMTFIN
jgi:hypothetical protein